MVIATSCYNISYILLLYICIVVEGKRSSGKAAVWVSRDRFAVLDKANQVHMYVLYSVYFKCSCVHACVCVCVHMHVCMERALKRAEYFCDTEYRDKCNDRSTHMWDKICTKTPNV